MRLYLVRHGRPDVPPGVCYGRHDVIVPGPEHERVAAALLPQLPSGVRVWSSPARRCAGLAASLASSLGSPGSRLDARLREMDFGDWEMRRWDEIGRAGIDAWVADLLHYRPGGGECVMDVATRVASFHAELFAAGTGQAIVVCHAGTIRLLSRLHAGLSAAESALAAATRAHGIGYGELLVLD